MAQTRLSIKPAYRTYFLLAFLLLLLPLTILATLTRQETRKQAAESSNKASFLTQKLAMSTSQKLPLEDLVIIASERKTLLLQEVEKDPQLFISHTLPKNIRDQLPQDLKDKGLIEQEIEIQGSVTILHFDDFENKKSRTEYKIEIPQGEYNLHFTNSPPELSSDSQILVEGTALDFEVAVDLSQESNLQILTTPTTRTTGEFRMAVLMFNFANDPFHKEPWTKEEIEMVVFGNESSAKDFYEEASYQKTFFSGGVFGWLELTRAAEYCDPRGWANEATVLSGINPEEYDRIAYLFPYFWQCEWGGMAIMGGREIWVNGMNLQEIPDSGTFIHELGHNFNLYHSNLITCGGKAIDIYTNCQVEEYWDRYDEMGLQKHHFNAAHKIKLKWIEPPNITDVFQSGEYVLYNFETPPSGPQVLRIRKPDTRHFYYIEYRRPIGFDASLPERIQNSSLVHLAGLADGKINSLSGTFLIDTTPSNHINADESLIEDGNFYDEINQITVSQINHYNAYATVSITLPPSMVSTCPENVNQDPSLGKAAYFNEQTYIEIPPPNSLQGDNNKDFTIEAWIKPEFKDKYEGQSYLIHRKVPDIAGQLYSLLLGTPSDESPLRLRFGFGKAGPDGGWVQSDYIIPPDSWTHIAAVKGNGELKIFINGELVGNRPFIEITDSAEASNYLGGWVVPYDTEPIYAYRGMVDDLRISNAARDIESNWQNGLYEEPLLSDENTLTLWRLEENILDSAQDNDGVAHGNICFTEGRVGPPPSSDFETALKFDYQSIFGVGPAFVEVGPSDKLLIGSDFTIEAWIKPDEELINPPGNDPQNPRFVLAKEGTPDEAWGYSLDVASRKVEFGINLKSDDGTRVRDIVFGQTELETGRWYFLQAVKEKSRLSLYLNGQLEASKTVAEGAVEREVRLLTIGCAKMQNFPSCLSNFYGEIDEIRISDVARPTADIPTRPFSSDEHTVALWHFDQNALDSTNNDLDGRLNGNVVYVDSTIATDSISSTPSAGSCQCDLWTVVEDQCSEGYRATCTGKYDCECQKLTTLGSIQSWRTSWAQADKTAADLDASGTLNILDYLILFYRWLE